MKLKITTTKEQIESLPSSFARVRVTEDKQSKVVEKDGVTELVFGIGKSFKEVTPRDFVKLCRKIVRTAHANKVEKLGVQMEHSPFPKLNELGEAWVVSTIAENFLIANYEFTAYKSKKSEYELGEIRMCGSWSKRAQNALEHGITVGTYTNHCRDIANTPGGDMTPELLAEKAAKLAKGTKAKVSILDQKAIEKEKMGALLGVAKGAEYEPRFIIIEHWGAGKPRGKTVSKKQQPIVLVGKGVTFDTGGLNLKPTEGILDMHLDMSGGAAVIASVICAAKLGVKKNIIGLIPAAENAISDKSMRPGDVLTSMSGKTIDVLNTDAEGRLILADALTYASRYQPRLVVDVATLTGAALVALGQHASAVLTKDEKLEARLRELGEESGDYVWPLPLWDEYTQYTKGRFGDVSNIPTGGAARLGGTINGAAFLSHFAVDYPKNCSWAHIDMAPRMSAVPSDQLAKGATGEPTRLLIRIAEKY